jgi:hypothetical protein
MGQFLLHISGTFHDKHVVSIGVVGMPATQPLVDQNRQSQPPGDEDRGVKGGILVPPDRMMHPVQDEFAVNFEGKTI